MTSSTDENSWSKLKNATCSGRGCMTATCVANGNVIMIGGSSGFSAVSMSAEKIHHEIYAIAFRKSYAVTLASSVFSVIRSIRETQFGNLKNQQTK